MIITGADHAKPEIKWLLRLFEIRNSHSVLCGSARAMIHRLIETIGTGATIEPVSNLLAGHRKMARITRIDKILSRLDLPTLTLQTLQPRSVTTLSYNLARPPAAGQVAVAGLGTVQGAISAFGRTTPVSILLGVTVTRINLEQYLPIRVVLCAI